MIMTLMVLCSLTIVFLNHPLSCGLMLLIQTILITLNTGLMNYNFWYSYILFLIMVGGMLILFIYMTSIASNEKFKFNKKIFIISVILFMTSMLFYFDYFYFNFNIEILETKLNYLHLNNSISMKKYLNWPNNLNLLMMIMYLLITLIAIVKITKISQGPLRQKL